MCKNPLPPKPIHHWEKLEEVERKFFMVLVKPEKHRTSLPPLAKLERRTSSTLALAAAQRYAKWIDRSATIP
jgi:hypothetical protein